MASTPAPPAMAVNGGRMKPAARRASAVAHPGAAKREAPAEPFAACAANSRAGFTISFDIRVTFRAAPNGAFEMHSVPRADR